MARRKLATFTMLRRSGARWLTLVLALLAGQGAVAAQSEPLTLRVNDATGRPGELMAVVIRTYAPRTLGQGQICFRALPAGDLGQPAAKGASPLAALDSFIVFSEMGDVISEGSFEEASQTALIAFESLSGTINQSDGPLAVLFFRVAPGASPGQTFEIAIDAGDSFLVDPGGGSVALELRAGDLEIVAPAAPFSLSADGDEASPGGIARLGVATEELFRVAFGRAAFLYDPALAAGAPAVSMDPRHGNASFAVDDSIPGRVVIAFTSVDASLNSIPGNLISIDLPISTGAVPGTQSPVWLDPELTFLAGPSGATLPLELDGDVLEIVPPAVLFSDGFETGDRSRWRG